MLKRFLICLLVLLFFSIYSTEAKEAEKNKHEYINIPFWEHFNDDILIEHLNTLYINNNDLKSAAYKVNEAKRIVNLSFSNELPHVGFDGYAGYTFHSSDELFGDVKIPDYNEAHFLLPLTYSYELDIFGKNHLKTKSMQKISAMSEQDEKALYISISSTFAGIYFNLIKTDKLIEYQKELIKTQEKVAASVDFKYKTGTTTINDVLAAKKTLTYMKEDLENLMEKQDVLQNQISVLLSDRSFGQVNRKDFDELNFDVYIPDKLNINVLESRPDRVKAELNLEKCGIDVRIAKRNFLPTFNIVGNIGFNLYNISSPHKFLSDIGVLPNLDIFDGGRKYSLLKLQKDKYDNAVQEYEKVILESIKETNDSLYSLKSNHKKYLLSKNRVGFDDKEYKLAAIKVDVGMADNLDLLLRKIQLLNSEKQYVSLKTQETISAVSLYKALGGVDYFDNQKEYL